MKDPYQKEMNQLCYWAKYHLHDEDLSTCPKVGYLGYINGWTMAEECAVSLIADALIEKGLRPRDYFRYNVDSSG